MAVAERDGPSERRGQLMKTRDDLQLLRCQDSLETHLLLQTLICLFRYFGIFLLVPPVISGLEGAIFCFSCT